MVINKNDFIEIEFTGKLKGGEVFDSNVKSVLEKSNLNIPAKPFIFSVGNGMFLKAIENFLIGKDLGKYEVSLDAKDAFGERNFKLIKRVPFGVFSEQNLNPSIGAIFNFDGKLGRVLSISGGRVLVDFNNPLAGKDVEYSINVLRKVTDKNEQINAFNEFLFKQKIPFEIKDKKLILKIDKQLKSLIPLFKQKYKELFGLDLEAEESGGKEKNEK